MKELIVFFTHTGHQTHHPCFMNYFSQNLESATVSRSLATRLLDAALEANKWDLSKDLIRFLRSIGESALYGVQNVAGAL